MSLITGHKHQANPTSWAHIYVKHEKIDDHKFLTSSRYNYQPDKPYREQVVEVTQPHVIGAHVSIIIVKNPACDMIFSYIESEKMFLGHSCEGCMWKDKPLESKARLYKDSIIHGIKGIGKVVKVSFTSKRMYKYT